MDRPWLVEVMIRRSRCGTWLPARYSAPSQAIQRLLTVWRSVLMDRPWSVVAGIIRSKCGERKALAVPSLIIKLNNPFFFHTALSEFFSLLKHRRTHPFLW